MTTDEFWASTDEGDYRVVTWGFTPEYKYTYPGVIRRRNDSPTTFTLIGASGAAIAHIPYDMVISII